MNFVIVGSRGWDTVISRGLFGEVLEGKVENAHYVAASMRPGLLGRAVYHFTKENWVPHPIRCRVQLPWEVNYATVGPLLRSDMPNCVLFCPGTHTMERVSPLLMRALRRKRPDCRTVYYLVDGVERTALINRCSVDKLRRFLEQFDAVYTYDAQDAETFHYRYIDTPVWSDPNRACDEIEYDLYFCGRNKERLQFLDDICKRLKDAGVTSRFMVTGNVPEAYRNESMHSVDWRPYPQVVVEAKKARCLLEVLAGTNTGSSLRYKEAVIYNKKLLTNNADVVRMPYYDARWMRVFTDARDIDVDWLRADEPVDYGYRGDFSARSLLDRIAEDLERG